MAAYLMTFIQLKRKISTDWLYINCTPLTYYKDTLFVGSTYLGRQVSWVLCELESDRWMVAIRNSTQYSKLHWHPL